MADEAFISNLIPAENIDQGMLFETSKPDTTSATGYISRSIALTGLGDAIVNTLEYQTKLETNSKTITGAINELKRGGGGGGSSVAMSDNPTGGVDLTVEAETRTLATEGEISDVKADLPLKPITITPIFHANNYWNSEDEIATIASYTGAYFQADPIPVEGGEEVFYCIRSGGSSKQNPIIVVDENFKILLRVGRKDQTVSGKITIPHSGKFILATAYNASYLPRTVIIRHIRGRLALSSIFEGKKFSILGDSVSAFSGTIPQENLPYYTASNSDTTRVYIKEQMWWSVLADTLKMTPLIIDGWSGSAVMERADRTGASNPSRCQDLADGDELPDIIIIAMGVNDYSYNSPMGDWNGKTALNDDVSSFRTAYATMLKRIHESYPDALVFCVSPWFMQRGTDNGATYTNGLGLTVRDYADAIKEIADIMNCLYIDSNECGFNRYNYYPTYCQDSSTNPTHPNAKGQEVMGKTLAVKMQSMYGGILV